MNIDLIDPPEDAAPAPVTPPPFELESPTMAGAIAEPVLAELRRCYREAKDYAAAYGDAVKAQAEKHQLSARALRRYIAAIEGDKMDEARAEAEDLERLIEGTP